jgi:hypothetical protein
MDDFEDKKRFEEAIEAGQEISVLYTYLVTGVPTLNSFDQRERHD